MYWMSSLFILLQSNNNNSHLALEPSSSLRLLISRSDGKCPSVMQFGSANCDSESEKGHSFGSTSQPSNFKDSLDTRWQIVKQAQYDERLAVNWARRWSNSLIWKVDLSKTCIWKLDYINSVLTDFDVILWEWRHHDVRMLTHRLLIYRVEKREIAKKTRRQQSEMIIQ